MLKESARFNDFYITADYARAIQEERRELVKAMFKAKEMGLSAKAIDRHIIIDSNRYSAKEIPVRFRPG